MVMVPSSRDWLMLSVMAIRVLSGLMANRAIDGTWIVSTGIWDCTHVDPVQITGTWCHASGTSSDG